ncbi:hypothetical protein HDV00_008535 [Rhizophlyctis rosea]|nr:hypothetical protein HDV00_008535 [Rhizophlyctis rosea]
MAPTAKSGEPSQSYSSFRSFLSYLEPIADLKRRTQTRGALIDGLLRATFRENADMGETILDHETFSKWTDDDGMKPTHNETVVCHFFHQRFSSQEELERHEKSPRHREVFSVFSFGDQRQELFRKLTMAERLQKQLTATADNQRAWEVNPMQTVVKVFDTFQLKSTILQRVAELQQMQATAVPGETITGRELEDLFSSLDTNTVDRLKVKKWPTVAKATHDMIRILLAKVEKLEKELKGVDERAFIKEGKAMDIGTTDRCPEYRALRKVISVYEELQKKYGSDSNGRKKALLEALFDVIEADGPVIDTKRETHTKPFIEWYIESLSQRRTTLWADMQKVEEESKKAQADGRANKYTKEQREAKKAERDAKSEPVRREYQEEIVKLIHTM